MTAIAWTGTFAMYDPSGAQMDANDGGAGVVANVTGEIDLALNTFTLSSTDTFFGLTWSTTGGTLYGPGTYTISTSGDVDPDGAGPITAANGGDYTFTVGAGQIGATIDFAWGTTVGIDVLMVWDVSTVGGITTYTSVDTNGDAETVIPGTQMIDGPFPSFSANFNMQHAEVIVEPPFVPVDVLTTVDFNNNTESDILWRNNTTGANVTWLDGDSTTILNTGDRADLNWKVAGIGDFNGDGSSDILWRNAVTGGDQIWNGGDKADTLPVGARADLNWKVAGIGDFNADGTSDILWRNTATGGDQIWNGGDKTDTLAVGARADLNWKVAGIGDFNADGTSDILWRNTATGKNQIWNGGDKADTLAVDARPDQNWKVAGIGDFNGDGSSDILWRNAPTGDNQIWNGADKADPLIVAARTGVNWNVSGVGDFNGDGTSDIMWRNANTGANNIWNGADQADTVAVANRSDVSWTMSAQTGTWLTADGAYPV